MSVHTVIISPDCLISKTNEGGNQFVEYFSNAIIKKELSKILGFKKKFLEQFLEKIVMNGQISSEGAQHL